MKTLNMPKVYFYAFVLMTLVFIITNPMKALWGEVQIDEKIYKAINDDFDRIYSTPDTKPIFFLYVQTALNGDYQKTRILNVFLIIICTYLIYKITNNKLSFLYFVIPIFTNSMWLTAEIIEVFFILLSFRYFKQSGLFIGLASIFRPYALLYALLLNNKQRVYVLFIVSLGLIYLYFIGDLSIYINRLWEYGTKADLDKVMYLNTVIPYDLIDYFCLAWLVLWFIIGFTFKQEIRDNQKLWQYILISIAPLWVKMYAHYFLVPYTMLFLGFLLSYKSKDPLIKEIEL